MLRGLHSARKHGNCSVMLDGRSKKCRWTAVIVIWCETGKDALYLHPTVLSGVMQEDHIPALQQLLVGANTFQPLGARLYRECFDLDRRRISPAVGRTNRTDRQRHSGSLPNETEKFISHRLDCRSLGRQFAIRRLTDWERSGPYIAEGYVGERIGQLIADGRLITAQTRYGQGLRTATEAELKMAENADPRQMHF